MKVYTHALILVHGKDDGIPLLAQAVALAEPLKMKITLAHVSEDYRVMNYVSDSVMNDVVSEDIIKAKALLDELAASTSEKVDTRELVTLRRFEDVEKCIAELGVDLVIAGHRNRFMGALTSRSAEYINHISVDVLIRHLHH